MAAILVTFGCRHRSEMVPTAPSPASPTAAPAFELEDIAASAGLNYQWVVPGPRPLNILQTIGNGCAFLDYNNDGNLDILLVGPKVALYRGDGKGHFTDVSHETGIDTLHGQFLGCAVGDYDNDGYEDIYLTAYRGGALLHNEGGKRFKDVTRQAGIAPQPWGTSASFVDIDNDGKLDLVIGNYVIFGPHTNPQMCVYSGIQAACGPKFYRPLFPVNYHNDGGGHFTDVSRASGVSAGSGKTLGIACADYNGSGRQSIAYANDEMPGDLMSPDGRIYRNEGPAAGIAFDSDGHNHGGMGVDWGDYDNDGKLDLAVATFEHEAKSLYHNDGAGFNDRSAQMGVMEYTIPYVAFGVKFVDIDNDGWLDLVFTNGHVDDNVNVFDKGQSYREPSVFLRNVAGTHFEKALPDTGAAATHPIVGRGLAIGDFDNDGRMDLLLVDSEGAPMLLHNVTRSANHWLTVSLVGVKSNRDGIGALVTVDTGTRRLLRRCATDGSYMSASDKRVHFGLGPTAGPVTVFVHWPSGHVDRISGIMADSSVTIQEGIGIRKAK
jgi:hypothetical protein